MSKNIVILRQGSYNCFYDMPLEINWSITNMCNYNCTYCFGHDKINKNNFSDINQINIALQHLYNLNRSEYYFCISGGEPTIHPHFFDLLLNIKLLFQNKLKTVLILSNGSRNYDLYNEISNIAQDMHIKMNISIHTEFCKAEHIFFLIKKLSQKIDLNFALMFHPEKFLLIKELYEELCKLREHYAFGLSIRTLREPPHFAIPDKRYNENLFQWQHEANQNFLSIVKNTTVKKINFPLLKNLFWDIIEDGKFKIFKSTNREKVFQNGMLNFKNMFCSISAYSNGRGQI